MIQKQVLVHKMIDSELRLLVEGGFVYIHNILEIRNAKTVIV